MEILEFLFFPQNSDFFLRSQNSEARFKCVFYMGFLVKCVSPSSPQGREYYQKSTLVVVSCALRRGLPAERTQLTALVCSFPVQNRLVMGVNLSQCILKDL